MSTSTSPAIGIDLGTTNSCVGVWLQKLNRVEIIKNDQGNSTTPSCVSFSDYEQLVGEAALNYASHNPTNTIYDVKRLIGRRFSDPSVQNDMRLWPFTVVSGPIDKPYVTVKYKGMEKRFCPEEISAMVLAKMKEIAEAYTDCPVRNAVITVPAYFDYSQRRSTMDAAAIASINVLHIMDEPIAAAVAYGLHNSNNRYVLVFDLGESTFDVSLLSNENGTCTVKATTGDSHLGDEAFNKPMINYFIKEFKRKYGKDISGDRKAMGRLNTACERAKIDLCYQNRTMIQVDYLYDHFDFSFTIDRVQFDELNADLYKRCMDLVERCIKDAKVDKQSIDEVVLVGGSTRIPKVQYLLQEYFPGKRIRREINPEEVVAYGAAIQAAKLSSESKSTVIHQLQLRLLETRKLAEQLASEGEIARKEVEAKAAIQFKLSEAQKLVKQLTSERDNANKEVEEKAALQIKLSEAQKLIEQLTSERDNARKCWNIVLQKIWPLI